MILEQLIERRYAELTHSIPRAQFEEAVEAFLDVLELPEGDLRQVQVYQLPKGSNETALGYTRKDRGLKKNTRTGKRERQDGKRYIQIDNGGALRDNLVARAYAECTPAFRDFLEHGTELCLAFEQIALPIIEEAGERWPKIRDYFLEDGRIPNLQIRFLAYDENEAGDAAAGWHLDKSGITLTGWESAPGLHIIPDEEEVPVSNDLDGRSIVMTGKLLEDATSGAIRALPHLVRQESIPPVRPGVGRVSVICFLDQRIHPGMRIPEWEKLHAVG